MFFMKWSLYRIQILQKFFRLMLVGVIFCFLIPIRSISWADPLPGSHVLPDVSKLSELPLIEYMRLSDVLGREIRQFMTPEGIFCRIDAQAQYLSCDGRYQAYLPVNKRSTIADKCVEYNIKMTNYWHSSEIKYHQNSFVETFLNKTTSPEELKPCGLPPYPDDPVTPFVLLKEHPLTPQHKISFRDFTCAELDNQVFTCQSAVHSFVLQPDGTSWAQ